MIEVYCSLFAFVCLYFITPFHDTVPENIAGITFSKIGRHIENKTHQLFYEYVFQMNSSTLSNVFFFFRRIVYKD